MSPTPGGHPAGVGSSLVAYIPAANSNPETLLLRFATPIWDHPESIAQAENQLNNASQLRAVSGPLDSNGTAITVEELVSLHAQLGPAAALPATPPANVSVPKGLYQAYPPTAQFITADGRTVQFYAISAAVPARTPAAINSIPPIRAPLDGGRRP